MKQEGAIVGSGEAADTIGGAIMAAHEIKAPLALIRQLALALESDDEPNTELLVERIRLTSERALRLVNDLTVASRQDALFELEPIHAAQFCQEVTYELQPLYVANHRSISVRSPRRIPLVVGHRELLRRVLLNFGDNALHYTPKGSSVELAITTHGDRVRLGMRDFGPALPHDTWQRLTHALRQSTPHPISTRPHSSGLGLYLSGQFAEKMNSSIGVTRHRDGTTFYIDMMASRQLSLL